MKPLSARVKRLHQALRCQQKALAALKLTPLRILLTQSQLNTMSSQAKGIYLEPGEILYKHGDEGDFLAVLSKGIMKYENSPFERTAGDLIYDLDECRHRTRTIIALTRIRLFTWKISEMEQLHLSKVQPLISHISIKNSLMKSTLFSGLSGEQIDTLCDIVHWRGADVNEIVIKEGSQGQSLYIVDQGLLKCFIGSVSDLESQMNLGNVVPGDYIGEIALLIGIPRTASAMAVEPTCLMEIRARDFAHLVQNNPRVGEQIRNRIHIRIIMQFRRYRCTFFELLTDEQIHDLGPRCHLQLMPIGTTLFRVGDAGDLFYMIVFGQVQLRLYNNDMTISTETLLNAGSYFGELALRHDTPRYASAMTLTLSLFLTLSRAQFSYLFKQQQLPLSARLPTPVEDLINVWRLLQTESGRILLATFAANRIAPDMITFWYECDTFQKSAPDMKQDELRIYAKKIISLRLTEEANKNVGLPTVVKDQLLQALEKDSEIDGNVFNVAKFAIGRIVTSEVFPYLKHTDIYAQLARDELSSQSGSKTEYWDETKPSLQTPSSFNLESMSHP